VEPRYFACGNLGDCFAQKIGGFRPATAKSESNIVALDAREFLDDGGGVARQGERAIRCLRGLGRHENRLLRIRTAGTSEG
jgi:hypothetical protein